MSQADSTTSPKPVDRPARRALITGITGQDGSYLAELLLAKGYEVHGLIRRASTFNTDRIDHLYVDPHESGARLFLHFGDLTDGGSLRRLLADLQPAEIYNLAAQSHVAVSFAQPEFTADVVALGTLRLLEAVRDLQARGAPPMRVYQAGSSEMFGDSPAPQSESTPFSPRSPYAVAKVMAHQTAVLYREAWGLFVANGILFNHESPRRGETFVTRKISRAVGRIRHGLQDAVWLGNLAARRDWGFAGDFVEGMWRMLQHDQPEDFVLATGQAHSVQDFAERAFAVVDLDWRDFVRHDPRYLRPAEVPDLCGDAGKARHLLDWAPSMDFDTLVRTMVEADLALARREKTLQEAGHDVSFRGRGA